MAGVKKTTDVGGDVGEKETLSTVDKNVNCYNHYGSVWRPLKTLRLELLYDSALALQNIPMGS